MAAETQAETLKIMAAETQTVTLNSNAPFSPIMPTTPYGKNAPGKHLCVILKLQIILLKELCLFCLAETSTPLSRRRMSLDVFDNTTLSAESFR